MRENLLNVYLITSFSRAVIITSYKSTNESFAPAKTRGGTMNIEYRVYLTFCCTNQSVECDIAGIWKDRKFSCPKLGCRTGKIGKIIPQTIL